MVFLDFVYIVEKQDIGVNWRFLDFNYFLWCEEGFGEGGLDNKEKLVVYFNEEEFLFCEQYELKLNKLQKIKF